MKNLEFKIRNECQLAYDSFYAYLGQESEFLVGHLPRHSRGNWTLPGVKKKKEYDVDVEGIFDQG